MSRHFICHYSEIGLKGKNRSLFENQLIKNIRKSITRVLPDAKLNIRTLSKRIIVTFENDVDDKVVFQALQTVFGIVNFSAAHSTKLDINEIQQKCLHILGTLSFTTFAIRSKRSNKQFPFTTYEINAQVGAHIADNLHKKVDLTHPDITCFIEILDEQAYVYAAKESGLAGLPVEISGRVLVLLSGGFDSPVAAWFAMKRGARCDFVHFHSFPYTNKKSQEKVKNLVQVLNKFQYNSRLFMVGFSETQEDIVTNCPDRLRIVLYRRFMMRIAGRIARYNRIKALVTGESLGQVASQTLSNIGVIEAVTTLPLLRPLIGLDKNEIMAIARNIGTYDISAQPHDDACTRFMPKHPIIHAKLDEVEKAENSLDIESLVARDIKNIEKFKI